LSKKKLIVIVLIVILVVASVIAGHFIWARATLPGMRIAVAGDGYTVAIATDGSLWAWGLNNWGQLGDGTTTNRSRPVQISADTDWVSVAADSHNIAIRADGSLWAWGRNHFGQLGDGTTENRARPVQIGTDTDWASVATVFDTSFAIKEDGTLWHWGERRSFVADPAGPGSWPFRRSYSVIPVQVGSDTDWAGVSASPSRGLAIRTDGTLWVWGDLDGKFSFEPLQLGEEADWVSATIGSGRALSIKADGSLWDWRNADFTTPNNAVPTQIGVDTTWAMVTHIFMNVAAISTDGSLWTWGSNRWGILGDGTPQSAIGRPIPVRVREGASVSLSSHHMVAVCTDGRVWTSGSNRSGQLGRRDDSDGYSLTLRPITRRLLWHRIGEIEVIPPAE
jgi:alpha-tubulin suppressor-like RCC1 family protein